MAEDEEDTDISGFGCLAWIIVAVALAYLIELLPDDWLPRNAAMFIWVLLVLLSGLAISYLQNRRKKG